MHVVGDDQRLDREQALEMGDPGLERPQGLPVAQIADVVTDPGSASASETERVLELGAATENRAGGLERQGDARGRETSRAADQNRCLAHRRVDGADDRVVAADVDRTVVEEERVGDRREPLERVGILVGDRLVGAVAGGHHQHVPGGPREQVVKGRVGQHHAEVARARRHRGREAGAAAPAGDHDRALRPGQQLFRRGAELDQSTRRPQVCRHQRERLLLAVLAGPERVDGTLVGCDAGEVVAAESLDRDDRALAEERGRRLDRVGRAAILAVGAEKPGARPALRTGVRLRVEAAVEWILVLGSATRAHLESRHRRQRPVVGDAADDRQPRAAVGAVDERIAVAAVGRVEELRETVVAGRHVRSDLGLPLAGVVGGEDPKPALAVGDRVRPSEPLDRGERRLFGDQAVEERLDLLGAALDLEQHPSRVVEHEAAEPELGGEPENVGTEADALHRPLDAGANPTRPSHTRGGGRSAHRHRSPARAVESSISSRTAW